MTTRELILNNPVIKQSIEDYRTNMIDWYMGWYKKFCAVVNSIAEYEPYKRQLEAIANDPFISYCYKDKPEQVATLLERTHSRYALYAFRESMGYVPDAEYRTPEYESNKHIINSAAYRMAPTFIKGEARTKYMVNKLVDEATELATNKLVAVITKRAGNEITSFETIEYDHRPTQWCGLFLINREITISVKLIWAGGYNIQCLHTRYIANIIKRNEKVCRISNYQPNGR